MVTQANPLSHVTVNVQLHAGQLPERSGRWLNGSCTLDKCENRRAHTRADAHTRTRADTHTLMHSRADTHTHQVTQAETLLS